MYDSFKVKYFSSAFSIRAVNGAKKLFVFCIASYTCIVEGHCWWLDRFTVRPFVHIETLLICQIKRSARI